MIWTVSQNLSCIFTHIRSFSVSVANRQLYTSPDNDELEKKIDQVDQAFAKGTLRE